MQAASYPIAFDLDRGRSLSVRWSDGVGHEIPLADLRRACPCATCRALREELSRNPLTVLSHPAGGRPTASTAELVGVYALRLRWEDGHDTGIYDFGLLRALGEQIAASGASAASNSQ